MRRNKDNSLPGNYAQNRIYKIKRLIEYYQGDIIICITIETWSPPTKMIEKRKAAIQIYSSSEFSSAEEEEKEKNKITAAAFQATLPPFQPKYKLRSMLNGIAGAFVLSTIG